jgi:PKD repeat protein
MKITTLTKTKRYQHTIRSLALAGLLGWALTPAAQAINLVNNGGFETGDFTGWTTTPASWRSLLLVYSDAPHTGSYAANFLANGGEDDRISQTLSTVAGQSYDIKFWVANESPGTIKTHFAAAWNGGTFVELTDPPQFGFTLYQFTLVASGNFTVLEFSGQNYHSNIRLDDISVVEVVCGTPSVAITAPAAGAVYPVNTPVTFTGTFDNANGPHTAQWNIDGNLMSATVNESTLTVSDTFTFAGPGVYSVQLTVANECGNSTTTDTIADMPAAVVIYDPSAGFVTGGGWINSPAGACAADPSLIGKAHFAFVSKYKKGATTPTGETSFQFKVAALNFTSQSYDWLVVSGARAQYKGIGTVNGTSGFGFMLTAVDGQLNGGGGTDKFRIKIWDIASSVIVYDNQMGATDSATPSTVIGGGSITIQK